MSTTLCHVCDHLNSESESICANCGTLLKKQRPDMKHIPNDRETQVFTALERNSIASCCVLSLLLFFFPLLTIHVPVAGDQDVTGYDFISKLNDFRKNLKPANTSSSPDLPLSVRLAWLIPVFLVGAFLYAAVALISAFKSVKLSRMASTLGGGCSAAAILYITIM